MPAEQKKKFIDLEEIIRDKNPRLLTFMPRFVLNYIKRIIHQKEVNAFIDAHGEKKDLAFVNAVIAEFGVKVDCKGEENIPAQGGCIFASNHPLGGLDALAIMQVVSKTRKDLKFIVNDILLQLKNLEGIFAGVNKHGKTAAQMLEEIDKLYGSEQAVFIFPAGLVSRKQSGVIKDLEWKKSFITKAKKYKRSIVPVFVDAKNSRGFYNLALWRKRLGIKANIEMLYLVDEMYHQRNKTISVIFGKPLPYSIFDKKFSDQEWAAKVKEHVYALHSGDKSKNITEGK
jgi:putative hemolysin